MIKFAKNIFESYWGFQYIYYVCILLNGLQVLDARELPFQARSFDLVVDKGTVDALLCDKTGTANAR